MDKENDDLKELLDEGFRPLHEEIDGHTPPLQWFEQLVKDRQAEMKARFKRDFIVFLLIACCILTVLALTLFQMPLLFLLLQGAIFIGGTVFTGIIYVKKVKEI
ncbi:YxlC family protein [Bacillus sp. KH172YL63]|uniref:YxlC family protein n=1 Tax=Bacillus sp. KH172YL63 TaxID=2709784 RepID=UPI0013E49D37|nr:YxlC family protein [Bacillus sp. KH172YL63]BCB02881.1 hypothetical protein KH172YL63_10140 [Bacillus sp. KH172YL63]